MILIDTGPLVALCDPRDSLHKIAIKDLRALARYALMTCEPVLAETCFHLCAASQRIRLQTLLERLDILPVAVDDNRLLWKEVFEWLNQYKDHTPDWTDAYLAVVCGQDRKFKLWTYDVEFRTIWRRPDGSSIPLAIRK